MEDQGSVTPDLAVQIYPQGQMTQQLDKLNIGDTVLFKGPKGRFKYQTNSKRAIGERPRQQPYGSHVLGLGVLEVSTSGGSRQVKTSGDCGKQGKGLLTLALAG